MRSHGKADATDKTYMAWCNMRACCDNPNHVSANIYYDRGIRYDTSWNDYEVFLADMGPSPVGSWLDRKNGALGYSKENCRWADSWEHGQNKSSVRLTEADVAIIKRRFKTKTKHGHQRQMFYELAEQYGVSWTAIRHIYRGNTWCNIKAAE